VLVPYKLRSQPDDRSDKLEIEILAGQIVEQVPSDPLYPAYSLVAPVTDVINSKNFIKVSADINGTLYERWINNNAAVITEKQLINNSSYEADDAASIARSLEKLRTAASTKRGGARRTKKRSVQSNRRSTLRS